MNNIITPDNITPYDVLIYSAPKSGGNTLQTTLMNNNLKVYYTHDKMFFESSNPACQNNKILLLEFINKQLEFRKTSIYNKKLNIFCIYRPMLERQISAFFQNYEIYVNKYNINKLNNYNLINYFNNNILNFDITDIPIFETFDIQLDKFKKNNNYYVYELNDWCNIYIISFKDINNWCNILRDIYNESFKLVNSNYSINKYYYNIMKNFKNEYFIDNIIYNKIQNDSIMQFFYSSNEQTEYINKYKINKDKTLVGKDYILFLQNDINNSLINFIDKSKNILLNYDNKVSSVINNAYNKNIYTFIYPDKSIIYNDLLPNYMYINEIYLNDYININNNIYYNISIFDCSDYYKYDTHINIKGLSKFIKYLSKILHNNNITININNEIYDIIKIDSYLLGFGDLLWDNNFSNIYKKNIDKKYFNTDNNFTWKNIKIFYCNTVNNFLQNNNVKIAFFNNKTDYININKLNNISFIEDNVFIDWKIISSNIIKIFNYNALNKYTVIIFYDSFSTHLMPILIKMFNICIFIKESITIEKINYINYDICLNLINFRFII